MLSERTLSSCIRTGWRPEIVSGKKKTRQQRSLEPTQEGCPDQSSSKPTVPADTPGLNSSTAQPLKPAMSWNRSTQRNEMMQILLSYPEQVEPSQAVGCSLAALVTVLPNPSCTLLCSKFKPLFCSVGCAGVTTPGLSERPQCE